MRSLRRVLTAGLLVGSLSACGDEAAGTPAVDAGAGVGDAVPFVPGIVNSLGGAGDEHVVSLVARPGGGALLGGFIGDTIELDGANGSIVLEPLSSQMPVLLAIDPDGKVAWARGWGSPAGEIGPSVAVAGDTIAVAGMAGGNLSIVGLPAIVPTSAPDAYVAAIGVDGTARWSVLVASVDNVEVFAAATPEGDVLLAGGMTTDVSIGETVLSKESQDLSAFYVAKLAAADGAVVWSRVFGAAQFGTTARVAVGPGGDALVVADVNSDPGLEVGCGPVSFLGDGTIVLARCAAADGACVWSWGLGRAANGMKLTSHGGDRFALLVPYSGMVDLGAGPAPDGPSGGEHLYAATFAALDGSIDDSLILVSQAEQLRGNLALGPAGAAALAVRPAGGVAIDGVLAPTGGPADLLLLRWRPGSGYDTFIVESPVGGADDVLETRLAVIDELGFLWSATTYRSRVEVNGQTVLSSGGRDVLLLRLP